MAWSGSTLDVPLAAAVFDAIRTAQVVPLAASACGSPVGVARSLSGSGASGGRVGRDSRAAELRGAAAVPTRGWGLGGPAGLLGVGSVRRTGGGATRAALGSPGGASRVSGLTGLFLRSGVSAEQLADLIRPKSD